MVDLHNYRKRVDTYLRKIRESDICEPNKVLLYKFADDCLSERLTYGRVYKHLYHLIKIGRLLEKEFALADIEDIRRIMRFIETGPDEYSESTKKDFRITVKKFWKWLNGGTCPDIVKWIKIEPKLNERRLPEEILAPGEVRALVQAADNPRDKAFIMVLYESGCRICEMMTIQLKHVHFDEYGAQLTVRGKTGSRRVRIILGCDYLRYWLENHPLRKNFEAFLWTNLGNRYKGGRLSYQIMNKRMKGIASRANVHKRVNFHAFRHARATHLADKLTEVQLCEVFGWTLGSKMPRIYVHLSGRNVDDALLRMHGLKTREDESHVYCPRCKTTNNLIDRYCSKCGLPFGLEVALNAEEDRKRYDDAMTNLMANKKVREVIIEALLGGKGSP